MLPIRPTVAQAPIGGPLLQSASHQSDSHQSAGWPSSLMRSGGR